MNDRITHVMIRCDGSVELGLGHLMRCMALAEPLVAELGARVTFAVNDDALATELLYQRGYACITRPPSEPESDWLQRLLDEHAFDVVFFDVRNELPREAVAAVAARVPVAIYDDSTDRRLAADLAVYLPSSKNRAWRWEGSRAEVCIGFEYGILRPSLRNVRRTGPMQSPPRVLVSMGGSDPAGVTLLAVNALEALPRMLDVRLLLGPGFRHHDALAARLATAHRSYRLEAARPDPETLFAQADVALVAFGTTVYEVCVVGTPAVVLAHMDDNQESIDPLVPTGAIVAVPMGATAVELGAAVEGLLADHARWQRASLAGPQTLDGLGGLRVAQKVLALAKSRRATAVARASG